MLKSLYNIIMELVWKNYLIRKFIINMELNYCIFDLMIVILGTLIAYF